MNKRLNELFGQALDAAVPYTWHNLDHVEVEKVMKVFGELIAQNLAGEVKEEDVLSLKATLLLKVSN